MVCTMQMMTTITSKFQVHIPVAARKIAEISEHGPALIKAIKGRITIEPVKNDFLLLGGKYKVANPIPVEKIRDHIDYSWGKK